MWPVLLALLFPALSLGSHFTWLSGGDSISWGCGNGFLPHEQNDGCEADAAAYRIPTAQALEQANITVTTVGSRSAGPASSPLAWRAHEGHPGWRIDQLTAIVPSWAALAPDVVSLLAGANDCLQGDGGALAITRMRALLNATTSLLPRARILVASILDLPGAGPKACQLALNGALPALAAQAGASVTYVPMAENTQGVCGDGDATWNIGDRVHPNSAGHARVASVLALYMRRALCPGFRTDVPC